jgi:hypothetical protein
VLGKLKSEQSGAGQSAVDTEGELRTGGEEATVQKPPCGIQSILEFTAHSPAVTRGEKPLFVVPVSVYLSDCLLPVHKHRVRHRRQPTVALFRENFERITSVDSSLERPCRIKWSWQQSVGSLDRPSLYMHTAPD